MNLPELENLRNKISSTIDFLAKMKLMPTEEDIEQNMINLYIARGLVDVEIFSSGGTLKGRKNNELTRTRKC
jgi:hypothetical protein